MAEGDRTDATDKAPLHAHRAARSLTTGGWGVSRKLWLALGTLMLVMVITPRLANLGWRAMDYGNLSMET